MDIIAQIVVSGPSFDNEHSHYFEKELLEFEYYTTAFPRKCYKFIQKMLVCTYDIIIIKYR